MTSPVVSSPTRPQRRALQAIEWYQRSFAGRPSPCRFFPSCSHYAHEAIEVHGTRRGLWLATRRLVRCRPFGPSGFDPVPLPAPRDPRRDDHHHHHDHDHHDRHETVTER